MRRLRVVGLSDDDETVILEDPVRHERFAVPGDERLRAAARGDVRRLGQMEIDTTTPLRPRDIQARIRAGESVEQVALGGGVSQAHVERFAYPVLLERARVAELAGRAHPHGEGAGPAGRTGRVGRTGRDTGGKDGPEADPRTLREIVVATLAARGQDPDSASWDAWKAEDGQWVVGLAWQAGRSDNTARWTYRPGPAGGVVTARDDPARDLLGESPIGGPRRVGEGPAETAATRSDAADGTPATTTSTATAVADEAAEAVEDVPVAATGTGEARPHRGPRATASATGTERRRARPGRDVPDQRRSPTKDAPAGDDAKGRKRHPIVPSWEDVLLGVRSPRE